MYYPTRNSSCLTSDRVIISKLNSKQTWTNHMISSRTKIGSVLLVTLRTPHPPHFCPVQLGKTEITDIRIWPQHIYIFGIVSLSWSIICHQNWWKLAKIGENWWKLVKLVSPTIPQHIYIYGIVLSSWSIICHQNWGKLVKIGENW